MDSKQVKEVLEEMTALVKQRYGEDDPDVWHEVLKAEAVLSSLQPAREPIGIAEVGDTMSASFIKFTDEGRALQPGKYDLFASPLPQSALSTDAQKVRDQALDVQLQMIHDTLHKVRAMVSDRDEAWVDIGTAMTTCRALQSQSLQSTGRDEGFYQGVIAALGALCPHYKHGDTIHDEIVRSVGKEKLYAAAEPEDIEWAGLDPEFYAAIAQKEKSCPACDGYAGFGCKEHLWGGK